MVPWRGFLIKENLFKGIFGSIITVILFQVGCLDPTSNKMAPPLHTTSLQIQLLTLSLWNLIGKSKKKNPLVWNNWKRFSSWFCETWRMMDLEESSRPKDYDTKILTSEVHTKMKDCECFLYFSYWSNGATKKQEIHQNKWPSIIYKRGQKQLIQQFAKYKFVKPSYVLQWSVFNYNTLVRTKRV